MLTLKYIIVLLGFIYHTYSAETCNKVCILENVNCMTRGASNIYKKVVHGIKGLIIPLDPLPLPKIKGEIEDSKYTLTNTTFEGFKNCTVTKLDLNATANTWEQYLHCPKLVSHFDFQASIDTKNPVLRGSGMAYLVAHDYDILNYGKYTIFVNDDHRTHLIIISQHTKIIFQGKLSFNIMKSNLKKSAANETVKYMNDHWRQTEKFLHMKIVIEANAILGDRMNNIYRMMPLAEAYPAKM